MRRGEAGNGGERPFHRVVAVLHDIALEAAAGVADHNDLPDMIWSVGTGTPSTVTCAARRSCGRYRPEADRGRCRRGWPRVAVALSFRLQHLGQDMPGAVIARTSTPPSLVNSTHGSGRSAGAGCWRDKQEQNGERAEQRQHSNNPHVIARSEATQAEPVGGGNPLRVMRAQCDGDCFVAALLAMTGCVGCPEPPSPSPPCAA